FGGGPFLAALSQGVGVSAITSFGVHLAYTLLMPTGLKRYYGAGHAHFITCGCYHRIPWLDTAARRDLFLTILEEVPALSFLSPWLCGNARSLPSPDQ